MPDGSAKAVYCSHVLEHIDRTSIVTALRNTYRILRPGGVFRLVVPDLAWRAEEFVSAHGRGDINAADAFMRTCHLGQKEAATGVMKRARQVFGNSDHRWMYDEAGMTGVCQQNVLVCHRSARNGQYDLSHATGETVCNTLPPSFWTLC